MVADAFTLFLFMNITRSVGIDFLLQKRKNWDVPWECWVPLDK